MASIVVVGSANTDLTVSVERLPQVNETVFGREARQSFGGKGANQALAAIKAGEEVFFLSRIGADTNGESLCRHLVSSGLAYEGLLRDQNNPSGLALIAVDRSGNNQIVVAPGSNAALTPQDVRSVEPRLRQAGVLLVQLEIPLETVWEALRLGRTCGLTTILDPAPALELPTEIYPLVDILTPNEPEAAALSGLPVTSRDQAEAAAEELLRRGCGTVLVTRGENGVLLSRREGRAHIPPFRIEPLDSVAAGDAFNGALAAALCRGTPLEEAACFAAAAGALCAARRGAQEALPDREAIERLRTNGPCRVNTE